MLYRMLLRQISRCRIGWKHAIGGYISALSHAMYPAYIASGGHLKFAMVRALARRECANRGQWELRRPTGDEGPFSLRMK